MARMITVKEAAERCRLSPTWFYRRIREKRADAPPHQWYGKLIRIPDDQFDEWMKGRSR